MTAASAGLRGGAYNPDTEGGDSQNADVDNGIGIQHATPGSKRDVCLLAAVSVAKLGRRRAGIHESLESNPFMSSQHLRLDPTSVMSETGSDVSDCSNLDAAVNDFIQQLDAPNYFSRWWHLFSDKLENLYHQQESPSRLKSLCSCSLGLMCLIPTALAVRLGVGVANKDLYDEACAPGCFWRFWTTIIVVESIVTLVAIMVFVLLRLRMVSTAAAHHCACMFLSVSCVAYLTISSKDFMLWNCGSSSHALAAKCEVFQDYSPAILRTTIAFLGLVTATQMTALTGAAFGCVTVILSVVSFVAFPSGYVGRTYAQPLSILYGRTVEGVVGIVLLCCAVILVVYTLRNNESKQRRRFAQQRLWNIIAVGAMDKMSRKSTASNGMTSSVFATAVEDSVKSLQKMRETMNDLCNLEYVDTIIEWNPLRRFFHLCEKSSSEASSHLLNHSVAHWDPGPKRKQILSNQISPDFIKLFEEIYDTAVGDTESLNENNSDDRLKFAIKADGESCDNPPMLELQSRIHSRRVSILSKVPRRARRTMSLVVDPCQEQNIPPVNQRRLSLFPTLRPVTTKTIETEASDRHPQNDPTRRLSMQLSKYHGTPDTIPGQSVPPTIERLFSGKSPTPRLDWKFDVFKFDEQTSGGSLVGIGLRRLSSIVPASHLPQLTNFLKELQANYLPNPYHNRMHGADVCNTLYCLMQASGLYQCVDNTTRLAAMVAALGM
eukprot:GHVQ01013017.1.p1 GENE.GHVQ01013017.1~~GHVQ01013017.1.p1  ORF type:complete len:719 (+),score=52.35 GHVQ01013017.1:169-2325(+)